MFDDIVDDLLYHPEKNDRPVAAERGQCFSNRQPGGILTAFFEVAQESLCWVVAAHTFE